MVQRLARQSFKLQIRVRFPVALPSLHGVAGGGVLPPVAGSRFPVALPIPSGRSIVGPLLLGVLGASLFLAGFFPCAEGCQPTTFSSKGHALVGLPGLLAFPLAPFFIWRRMRQDPLWEKFSSFSLTMGIVSVVILIGGFSLANVFGQEYVPVITKVLLIPQLGWPLGMAITLLKVSEHDST